MMRLCFRGNHYETRSSLSDVSTSSDRPTMKLMYRGCTYNYAPSPAPIVRDEDIDAPKQTLIYRGNTYQRRIDFSQTYPAARAINWRWQIH